MEDAWSARIQAAMLAGGILADAAEGFWEHGELIVTVRDGSGLLLFTVSMLAMDAPAAPYVARRLR